MKKGSMEGLPQNSGQPTAQGPLLLPESDFANRK